MSKYASQEGKYIDVPFWIFFAVFALSIHSVMLYLLSTAVGALAVAQIHIFMGSFMAQEILTTIASETMLSGLFGLFTLGLSYKLMKTQKVTALRSSIAEKTKDAYEIISSLDLRKARDKLTSGSRELILSIKYSLSAVSVFVKKVVVTLMPTKLFIQIAKVFPSFGGWFKHALYLEGYADDFMRIICRKDEGLLKELLGVLPKESLYMVLQRQDSSRCPPLLAAAYGKSKSINIFQLLLQAIEPQHRLKFLQASVGKGLGKMPAIFIIGDNDPALFWNVIKQNLTESELKLLVYTKDRRGDSLFKYKTVTFNLGITMELLEALTIEERINYLLEPCPHGSNPMLDYFNNISLRKGACIFDKLPKAVWNDIFASTPKNWTMTIGEKIMVMFYVQHKYRKESIAYFKEHYDLSLPMSYQELNKKDLKELLACMDENNCEVNCDTRDNFKLKHGETAEEILGVETYLTPREYVVAYRKAQLKKHPDKTQADTNEACAAISEARDFIFNKQIRDEYKTICDISVGYRKL